jgi:hypothetical protein
MRKRAVCAVPPRPSGEGGVRVLFSLTFCRFAQNFLRGLNIVFLACFRRFFKSERDQDAIRIGSEMAQDGVKCVQPWLQVSRFWLFHEPMPARSPSCQFGRKTALPSLCSNFRANMLTVVNTVRRIWSDPHVLATSVNKIDGYWVVPNPMPTTPASSLGR